jgi:hypothetical protein
MSNIPTHDYQSNIVHLLAATCGMNANECCIYVQWKMWMHPSVHTNLALGVKGT